MEDRKGTALLVVTNLLDVNVAVNHSDDTKVKGFVLKPSGMPKSKRAVSRDTWEGCTGLNRLVAAGAVEVSESDAEPIQPYQLPEEKMQWLGAAERRALEAIVFSKDKQAVDDLIDLEPMDNSGGIDRLDKQYLGGTWTDTLKLAREWLDDLKEEAKEQGDRTNEFSRRINKIERRLLEIKEQL